MRKFSKKENLEKLVRDKETKLLDKRKAILLKFKNEYPKFKKELINKETGYYKNLYDSQFSVAN